MITDLRTFPIGYITGLLNKLTGEFEQKCPYRYNLDEINIYIPSILQVMLKEDISNINIPLYNSKFRGYTILPGYEYSKIIIAHIRYPESNDERLYHSVDVVESVDLDLKEARDKFIKHFRPNDEICLP